MRRDRDSNPGEGLCRPLPNLSAIAPKPAGAEPADCRDSYTPQIRTGVRAFSAVLGSKAPLRTTALQALEPLSSWIRSCRYRRTQCASERDFVAILKAKPRSLHESEVCRGVCGECGLA
jgi:hypothetical protein